MSEIILIPDIGDFSDVPVIEVNVAVGDTIEVDTAVLMLESDKATMDIPSPAAGTVIEVLVKEGDIVSSGDAMLRVDLAECKAAPEPVEMPQKAAEPVVVATPESEQKSGPLVVIGGGPGGYTAAFRAADLGREVTLIDSRPSLGGVCLNVGCIPSKALLHIAKLRTDAKDAADHGLVSGEPKIDVDAIRHFKDGVVTKLTGGLEGLAKRRKVKVVVGHAVFDGPNKVLVETADGMQTIAFSQAIIAVGSEPIALPHLPDDPRVIDSAGALELQGIPKNMLIVGGGIIGLEMAEVYSALGSKVVVVELASQVIPGADLDLVKPLRAKLEAKGISILTGTKLLSLKADDLLSATIEDTKGAQSTIKCDCVLVAVGRRPNGMKVQAETAGVTVDERGFIPVDTQMRTSQPNIFAIGDVVGQPMLAHKATHEAKVAAEVACGEQSVFESACIPSVAYTDPEVAWVGLTETAAKQSGQNFKKGVFPWMASGRALSLGADSGLTKLIFDPETGKVLGGGIVGQGAGDLITEVTLAIEMGADAHDLGLTIHPHPTLSETVGLAAEAFAGTLTDL